MFRLNRTRVASILCLALFLYYLLFTESASTSSYRASTEAALARQRSSRHRSPLRGDLSDEELRDKVKIELEEVVYGRRHGEKGTASSESESESPRTTSEHVKQEHTADAKKMAPEVEDVSAVTNRPVDGQTRLSDQQHHQSEKEKADEAKEKERETGNGADPAKDVARSHLSTLLKTPLVIFSKSYCPHSVRAKHLLLDMYTITPAPKVVELDMLNTRLDESNDDDDDQTSVVPMTLGRKLQALLGEITGRKTVPNIIVGGLHSIGGNDRLWELHEKGELAGEIRRLGGKKIVSVEVNKNVE